MSTLSLWQQSTDSSSGPRRTSQSPRNVCHQDTKPLLPPRNTRSWPVYLRATMAI